MASPNSSSASSPSGALRGGFDDGEDRLGGGHRLRVGLDGIDVVVVVHERLAAGGGLLDLLGGLGDDRLELLPPRPVLLRLLLVLAVPAHLLGDLLVTVGVVDERLEQLLEPRGPDVGLLHERFPLRLAPRLLFLAIFLLLVLAFPAFGPGSPRGFVTAGEGGCTPDE
jgi:hypothetical protein